MILGKHARLTGDEATIPTVPERMSNAQLEAIIARDIEGGLDPAATDQEAQIIQ